VLKILPAQFHSFLQRERGGEGEQHGTDILRCEKISEPEDGATPSHHSWAGVRSSMLVGWDVNTANFLGVRRRLGPGQWALLVAECRAQLGPLNSLVARGGTCDGWGRGCTC